MRKVDIIIVGQGIAGTNLAFFAEKAGLEILVYDENHNEAASMVAAGLVNPLTGRKYVKSWMMDILLPFAKQSYSEMAAQINVKTFTERNIFRALYGPKEENLFLSKANDERTEHYIDTNADSSQYDGKVIGALNYGCVTQGMQVHLQKLLVAYRQYLTGRNSIINERFDYDAVQQIENGYVYKGVETKNIIFAEGHQASKNPFFNDVDFEPAKGEVLIVRIPSAQFVDILRHKMFVIPILGLEDEQDLYWVGSAYIKEYENDQPTDAERQRLSEQLESILSCDYEIIDHRSAIRPCVKQRRPQLRQHQEKEGLYLFAGMGTKGSSLAPYWAHQMVEHIVKNKNQDLKELTK